MTRWLVRIGTAACAGAAAIAITAAAAAQPSQDIKAEALALFNQARTLAAENRYPEACPLFERSQQIDPGMGTLFNLSNCYEQIGRVASARAGFLDVADAATAAGQIERARVAKDRAAALEPKLARLRIIVADEAAPPDLAVQRDGAPVSKLLWGTDVPVDPGQHVVSVSAPGKEPWSTTVAVIEPGQLVIVRVPPLAAVPVVVPPPPEKPPPPPPPEPRSAIPAIVLGSVTVVAVTSGVGLLVASGSNGSQAQNLRATIGTNGDAYNTCLARPAHPSCAELDAVTIRAATYQTLAIGAFIAGGLAAAGLTAYAVWPDDEGAGQAALRRSGPRGASARLVPLVEIDEAGPSALGAVLSGAF